MNLLSLIHRDYEVESCHNAVTTFWEVKLTCEKVNDVDAYNRLIKMDMETLRDNAKRLYEVLDKALKEDVP